MFANPAKAKHAAKVGLAMVVAFAIALQLGWINPYWAGFAVTFCSLTTQGESLVKIVLRICGTVLGVFVAFVILAFFVQDRWLFLLAVCIYLSIVTYLMTGTRATYMWQVGGFVAVIVMAGALGGPGDSNSIFQLGVARFIETVMGCTVWALIDMFIWPVTNQGALEKTARQLTCLQRQLIERCRIDSLHQGQPPQKEEQKGQEESFASLRSQQLKLIAKLDAQLHAAGAESYAVREVRALWEQLLADSRALLEGVDNWNVGIHELAAIDVQAVMPGFTALLDDVDQQLGAAERIWAGEQVRPTAQPDSVSKDPQVDRAALAELKHFDRAAIVVARQHLVGIAKLVAGLNRTAALLCDTNSSSNDITQQSRNLNSTASLPFTFDVDRLRASAYIVVVTCVGFGLWVYFDPPGHQSLWSMVPTLGFVAAMMPHMRIGSALFKAFGIYMPIAALLYILVMPSLSGYLELSVLIFAYVFWGQYLLASPLATIAAMLGLLNMMPIANEQTYSFVAVATSYLFLMLCLVIVVCFTYILGTPRPEKKFIRLVKRYFRSAHVVMSSMTRHGRQQGGLVSRYRLAFHQRELAALPAKMSLWGSQISQQNFPANSPAQIDALVSGLDGLSYRLHELLVLKDLPQAPYLVTELSGQMRDWGQILQQGFAKVSRGEAVDSAAALTEQLNSRLTEIERSMDKALASTSDEVADTDLEHAYRLLGAFRGVANTAATWLAVAEQVNWAEWREEVFS
jgi:uncharacterized membrane protein YgaE (UPF0421/DUF939 family)